jgi:hypothetical protein
LCRVINGTEDLPVPRLDPGRPHESRRRRRGEGPSGASSGAMSCILPLSIASRVVVWAVAGRGEGGGKRAGRARSALDDNPPQPQVQHTSQQARRGRARVGRDVPARRCRSRATSSTCPSRSTASSRHASSPALAPPPAPGCCRWRQMAATSSTARDRRRALVAPLSLFSTRTGPHPHSSASAPKAYCRERVGGRHHGRWQGA